MMQGVEHFNIEKLLEKIFSFQVGNKNNNSDCCPALSDLPQVKSRDTQKKYKVGSTFTEISQY